VGQAMIAGGTTVLLISASDCERGVLTESDELFTAVSKAVIVALITGGLGNAAGTASAIVNESVKEFVRYLIVGALTLGVSGVSTAITDTNLPSNRRKLYGSYCAILRCRPCRATARLRPPPCLAQ